jgi:hypothetical protein
VVLPLHPFYETFDNFFKATKKEHVTTRFIQLI